jgi:hypothetical protein
MNIGRAVLASSICAAILPFVGGCHRAYEENQLVGSWQLEVPMADARFTYYTNHTWVLTVVSSDSRVPSGCAFGSWKLQGDRVSTITYSTLDDRPARTDEAARITKLTSASLVVDGEDIAGKKNISVFHKVDTSAALPPDSECARKLTGTWLYSYTNVAKVGGARLYSEYEPSGRMFCHGMLYDGEKSAPAPDAFGYWKIDGGFLVTAITNSQSRVLAGNKESRDEIILITDSQFSYRDEAGAVKKVLRK